MTSIVVLTLFIISDLSIRINGKLPRSRNMQKWRTPSAFQLARIQQDYEMDYEFGESETDTATSVNDWLRRDEVVSDAECLERCNNRLNVGMDMVNAHMAFGSIDVPSVVERRDLKLFCLLDQQHSQCVDECGYTVQFNLREYVCKNRFEEMSSHLACYSRAAPVLARHCRPRCGHYSPLQHTFSGYGQRCRQLLCDHACANFIINKVCRLKEARSAAAFLLEFTRMQVDYWLGNYIRPQNTAMESRRYPSSCARLYCDDFSRKCNRRVTGNN